MHASRHAKLFVVGTLVTLGLLGLTPAGASSANISHSYHSGEVIQNGSLVSLDPQKASDVLLADSSNQTKLFGVAVATNDSLLAVNEGAENVQVATSGTANMLVSTLNGNIGVGDQIGTTPFKGIGAKAQPGDRVIGLAQTAFDGSQEGSIKQFVTDTKGNKTQISIGYVRVNIGLGTVAAASAVDKSTGLQKFAKSLTGHTVSTVRVVISMVIAIIAFLALVTLIYASIYGGIVSIGRNPLAKYAIMRSLISVLGMAAGMAAVTAFVIFMLLR
jgi:hypothetical protein